MRHAIIAIVVALVIAGRTCEIDRRPLTAEGALAFFAESKQRLAAVERELQISLEEVHRLTQ
jgi:hypothetical protein